VDTTHTGVKNEDKQMRALEIKSLGRGDPVSTKGKMERIHIINGVSVQAIKLNAA
jgi:hypothetical protein